MARVGTTASPDRIGLVCRRVGAQAPAECVGNLPNDRRRHDLVTTRFPEQPIGLSGAFSTSDAACRSASQLAETSEGPDAAGRTAAMRVTTRHVEALTTVRVSDVLTADGTRRLATKLNAMGPSVTIEGRAERGGPGCVFPSVSNERPPTSKRGL